MRRLAEPLVRRFYYSHAAQGPPCPPARKAAPVRSPSYRGRPLADARPQYSTRTHKKQKAPVAIRGFWGNQPHSLVGGQVSLASLIASDPYCSTGLDSGRAPFEGVAPSLK